jgi:hypothetical protein
VFKYLLAWLPMVPLAVLNGVLRETTYGRHLPELAAHQLSTLTAVVVLGVYVGFIVRRWPFASFAQAFAAGGLWVVATVLFECLFGRLVMGLTWARLLHDYDISQGRVWALFLLWLLIAPVLFHAVGRRAPTS